MRVANLKNVLLAKHDKQRKHPENAIWYSAWTGWCWAKVDQVDQACSGILSISPQKPISGSSWSDIIKHHRVIGPQRVHNNHCWIKKLFWDLLTLQRGGGPGKYCCWKVLRGPSGMMMECAFIQFISMNKTTAIALSKELINQDRYISKEIQKTLLSWGSRKNHSQRPNHPWWSSWDY